MRQMLRSCLALLLIADIAGAGALPVNSPMGMVAESKGCNLQAGTTLFVNSDVWTVSKGSAMLVVNDPSAKLFLLESSRLSIQSSVGLPQFTLVEGTLRFSVRAPIRLKVRESNVLLRPGKTGVVNGQVRLVGKNRLVVDAIDAAIPVEFDGHTVEVPAGFAYTLEMTTSTADPQGPVGAGANQKSSRAETTLAIITISATIIMFGWQLGRALTESDRSSFASPFVP